MRWTIPALGACAALAVACVPTYRDAADGAPSAALTFEKAYGVGAGLARGTLQECWIVKDATCAAPVRAGAFTWANSDAQTRRTAADRPVIVVARTRFLTSSGGVVLG